MNWKLRGLSPMQLSAYGRMVKGREYTARSLKVHTRTMGALARNGLIECKNEGEPGTIMDPVNKLLWSIL